jgi:hypothetical protein
MFAALPIRDFILIGGLDEVFFGSLENPNLFSLDLILSIDLSIFSDNSLKDIDL